MGGGLINLQSTVWYTWYESWEEDWIFLTVNRADMWYECDDYFFLGFGWK